MVSVKKNPTQTYCQSFDYVGQISVHLGTLDFFLSVTKYNYKEIQFSENGECTLAAAYRFPLKVLVYRTFLSILVQKTLH